MICSCLPSVLAPKEITGRCWGYPTWLLRRISKQHKWPSPLMSFQVFSSDLGQVVLLSTEVPWVTASCYYVKMKFSSNRARRSSADSWEWPKPRNFTPVTRGNGCGCALGEQHTEMESAFPKLLIHFSLPVWMESEWVRKPHHSPENCVQLEN